jgi:hypothetical protein
MNKLLNLELQSAFYSVLPPSNTGDNVSTDEDRHMKCSSGGFNIQVIFQHKKGPSLSLWGHR